MGRWIRACVLVLLLGAVTTVLVAWALAAWLPHRSLVKRYNLVPSPIPDRPDYVAVYELRRPGMVRRGWQPGLGIERPQFWTELAGEASQSLRHKVAQDRSWGGVPAAIARGGKAAGRGVEDARGWPFLALWCSLDESVIQGYSTGSAVRGGVAISRAAPKTTPGHFRALPLMPIWAGLAANTAVYAGAWLVILLGAGVARRTARRRRGRCLACGYDLRGIAPAGCPECGWGRPSLPAAG